MTPTATKTWSGDAGSITVNGTTVVETKSQVWIVKDAATLADVYAAVGLPRFNDPYEPSSPFKAKAITPGSKKGPLVWECRVDYGVPPLGDYPTQQVDLLQRPARVSWGDGFKQRPTERDAGANGGVPIKNSAGDFFDPLPVKSTYIETLTIKKYFPFYDRAMARTFRNHVNSNVFTVGNTTLLPGECFCRNIAPDTEYEATVSSIVSMSFEFEIDCDSRSSDPMKSGDPFDYHLVDQGRRGWYADGSTSKLGYFCITTGSGSSEHIATILTEPVLLDGTGKPIDPTIKVSDKPDATIGTFHAPVAGPSQYAITADYTSVFDKPGTTRIWRFYGAFGADFSLLPI